MPDALRTVIDSGGAVALSIVVYLELRMIRAELRSLRDVFARVFLAPGARPPQPPPASH